MTSQINFIIAAERRPGVAWPCLRPLGTRSSC